MHYYLQTRNLLNPVTLLNVNVCRSRNLSKKVNIKMSVENGSEPTLKDIMLSLASIKKTVDGINNRICSVEERLCKVEEKLCKGRELEIKVVSL